MKLLNTNGLSLDRLKSLIEISRAKGLSKAAPGDTLRQTLMGRQLKELEAFWGIPLHHKQGKHVVLNEHGKQLAATAQAVFRLFDDFSTYTQHHAMHLRIGSGGTLLLQLLMKRFHFIAEALPHVRWDIVDDTTQKLTDGLHSHKLDFAVFWGTPESKILKKHKLGEVGYRFYVPEKFSKKVSKKDKSSLFEIPLAFVNYRDNTKSFIDWSKHPRLLTVDENAQAFALIQSKKYAGILPELWGKELNPRDFKAIDYPSLNKVSEEVYLVWNPQRWALGEERSVKNIFDILLKYLKVDAPGLS